MVKMPESYGLRGPHAYQFMQVGPYRIVRSEHPSHPHAWVLPGGMMVHGLYLQRIARKHGWSLLDGRTRAVYDQ